MFNALNINKKERQFVTLSTVGNLWYSTVFEVRILNMTY